MMYANPVQPLSNMLDAAGAARVGNRLLAEQWTGEPKMARLWFEQPGFYSRLPDRLSRDSLSGETFQAP